MCHYWYIKTEIYREKNVQTPLSVPWVYQHPRSEDPCSLSSPHGEEVSTSVRDNQTTCLSFNKWPLVRGEVRQARVTVRAVGEAAPAPQSSVWLWEAPPHRVSHSNLVRPQQDKHHRACGQVEGLTPGLALLSCPWVSRADRPQK